MQMRCAQILAVLALSAATHAYSSGAPVSACGDMMPGHRVPAQLTPMPYSVTTSNSSVQAGKRMTIKISRGTQPPFKGFFVQVRPANKSDTSPALGRFFTLSHSKVTCSPGQENAITHSDSKEKESVTLRWESPADMVDQLVVFRVSVVQSHDTFWVGHESAPVRVAGAAHHPSFTTQSLPSAPAEERHSDSSRQPPKASSVPTVYNTCQLSKGCFTRSHSCIEGRICDLMVTYAPRTDGTYRLQLYGKHQPPGYLALGLSTDAAMGDDVVVYCTDREGSGHQIMHAYNNKSPKQAVQMQGTTTVGQLVADFSSEYRDGFLLCEFTHASRFFVGGMDVNLNSSHLHLMVASGPVSADGTPQYHRTARRVSGVAVQLSSSRAAVGQWALLFRVHGALMVTAWVGTASVGMLLPRYFKQTWSGRQLAGADLWFQGHRSLMVLTVLATLTGLVCVVLQLGGWTATPLIYGPGANPHTLLGVLCVALAVLQPLMALCRCHPGTPRRPIFNWLHWLVGSTAHTLGLAAVFFAVSLPAAQLPDWTYWVLAGFVLFHVSVHFILSVQQCWSDRVQGHQKRQGELYDMRDMARTGYQVYKTDQPQETPGSTLRRTVLGIYIVINLLFVALLVLMIVMAPADKWIGKILS